jgi:hypothetical protein
MLPILTRGSVRRADRATQLGGRYRTPPSECRFLVLGFESYQVGPNLTLILGKPIGLRSPGTAIATGENHVCVFVSVFVVG